MSTPMTAAQWLAALRAEGITDIVEMPNWKTHNRNPGRAWGDVHGLAVHHTAGVGTGMADYCYNGSAALPGPLVQDFLAKDGTLYLVGNGRCNHAGTIAANAHNAIVNEAMPFNSTLKPDATEPYDGNRELYGLEIENRGDGSDPYPAKQMDVAVRWAAARCRVHDWTAGSIAGHKELTRRKTDPSFDIAGFRRIVRDRLKGDTDMADLNAFDVWNYKGVDESSDAYAYLRNTKAKLDVVEDEVALLKNLVLQQGTQLVALTNLVKVVSAKLDA